MKKNEKAGTTPENIESSEMTDKKMDEFLLDLAGTIQWKALERLFAREHKAAETVLRTIDTFKEPTESARSQGKIMSMYSIQVYVRSLAERKNNPNRDEGEPIY